MARTHARIFTSIWDDPDFQVLSESAQRLYLLLLSQDSLNNAGRILLTVRRWSAGCKSTQPDDIRRHLAELDEHRFVVVDEDTEEVLIRSFIRNDGILKQPQMMKSALREALSVKSPRLRAVLADELRKLRREDAAFTAEQIDPGWTPDPTPGPGRDDSSPIQAQGSLLAGFDDPAPTPPAATSQSAELRRGRGRGSSSSSVRSSQEVGGAKRATRIPEDFKVTQAMVVWARQECPDVDGKYATDQFVDYWVAKAGKDALKLDWVRTWQGWMRRDDGADASPLDLLVFADAMPPVTFDLGINGWAPTLELTVLLRGLPAPGWLKVVQRARLLRDGWLDEECEIWDSAGRLVVQARQLAGYREPAAP